MSFLSDGTVVRLGDMAMADGLVACADDDTIDIVLADKDDILVMDAAGSSDGAASVLRVAIWLVSDATVGEAVVMSNGRAVMAARRLRTAGGCKGTAAGGCKGTATGEWLSRRF